MLLWKKGTRQRQAIYKRRARLFNYNCLVDVLEGWLAMSDTTIPKIQQFMPKKRTLATQSPGTKVDLPRNSSMYPCCSQRACRDGQPWRMQREGPHPYLSNDPKGKSREAEPRSSNQRRAWEIEWQKHHIPQKILLQPESARPTAEKLARIETYLTCADLVECDKCKRLSQHRTCQILLGQQQGNSNHREKELR